MGANLPTSSLRAPAPSGPKRKMRVAVYAVTAGNVATVVICVADWVLVEDFGFFGGVGTDPNSMIPMALVCVAGYVALVRPTESARAGVVPIVRTGTDTGSWRERLMLTVPSAGSADVWWLDITSVSVGRAELAEHVGLAEGLKEAAAKSCVSRSIDRIVWYAGWADKITQVLGGANPVAGPFFNFSLPTPSGVVAVVAPQESSLEGFVDTVLAPIVVGNTVLVIPSETRPTPAVLLGEMSATSDFPAGLLNIITGYTGELTPTLATHEDIDGLDLEGVSDDEAIELSALAAGSIKRVLRPGEHRGDAASLRRLRAFVETSTVWHTVGQ